MPSDFGQVGKTSGSAEMKLVVEKLQRALQLLGVHARERQSLPEDPWIQSARTNVLDACALLERNADRPESRTSAIELILKAELALASIDLSRADLSFRVADQLLLEARVRIEALNAG